MPQKIPKTPQLVRVVSFNMIKAFVMLFSFSALAIAQTPQGQSRQNSADAEVVLNGYIHFNDFEYQFIPIGLVNDDLSTSWCLSVYFANEMDDEFIRSFSDGANVEIRGRLFYWTRVLADIPPFGTERIKNNCENYFVMRVDHIRAS